MIRVGPHHRHRPYERERLAMTERLWDEMVRMQCVAALERALSEPLDGVDEPEDTLKRMRETY